MSDANNQTATLNLSSIMIGTGQLSALVECYEKVVGRPADWNDGNYYGWKVGDSFLTIGAHSEVSGQAKEPQRIILNMETRDVKAEFERMKALGVTVIKEPYDMEGGWIATLADPDGNYFQLVTPFDDMMG
jgi:predicted enzyme related to lactoylglutathione lyase